ncbi:hypothetical protein BD769DRAFT_1480556 [Suillus cothurnatus]|nr:hypothetical protein BD769DRAFT_1480556 [Suillus cothurnatus]
MRSIFIVVVIALTGTLSVNACSHLLQSCITTSDCCGPTMICIKSVSKNSLLCIQSSHDDSPFARHNIRRTVIKPAMIFLAREQTNLHISTRW